MNNEPHVLGVYKVGRRISSGGFGVVFSGEAPDGKQVAIKYERTYDRITRPYLQHEADVYRLLEGDPSIPRIYAYGREGRWNVMVFDILGRSLETLFEKCGGRFSNKTLLMLAPQVIDCIEYCHSKGIIHRDIKPDNFLIGRDDRANLVHIIDFGLSRRYRHPRTLKHFPYFTGHSFFGTTRFASLNALEGFSQSRRDDLESAAYTLIYLVRGRLPWQGLRGGTDKHRQQRVREKKRTWTPERLCEDLSEEVAVPLTKMLAYAKNLRYEEEPDYEYLRNLFRESFEKAGYEFDYDYDWLHIDDEGDSNRCSSCTPLSSRSRSRSRSGNGGKISEDSGSGGDADDESDQVAHKSPRSRASKDMPLSIHVEHEDHRIGNGDSAHSRSSVLPEENSDARQPPDAPRTPTSVARKAHVSASHASSALKRPSSRPNSASIDSRRSKFSDSETSPSSSSSSSVVDDISVGKGDFVLIKMIARDTIERSGLDPLSSVKDKSYWHQPSLSNDEWHFPYRPALVTAIKRGPVYCLLKVLSIMHRDDGLESVSPSRRPAFFPILSKVNSDAKVSLEGKNGLKLQTTPTWPLDGTYVHHQYDVFELLVPTSEVKKVQVVWSIDNKQLRRLFHARSDVRSVINADEPLSDAGSETNFVRERLRKRIAYISHTIYGSIDSLTEANFSRSDVDLKGSNGWSPEYFKTERRRNHENGYYTGDSDSFIDEENISRWTGQPPSNRRLSCTLATEGDVIVEAASVASSDQGSSRGFRYRSPRGSVDSARRLSKSNSLWSESSYRYRRHKEKKEKGTGSAPVSAANSHKSLRHVVLDNVARSAVNSPTNSRMGSEAGSDSTDLSHFSSDSDSLDASIRADPSLDNQLSTRSDAGSTSGSSKSRRSSTASSIASSIVGSAAGSVASLARSVAQSLMGPGDSNYNHQASASKGKIMADKAIQTEPENEGGVNNEASAAKGKKMVDEAVQTD